MTDFSRDWDAIGRYLAGESPPDEAAAVRRWLEEHPSDHQVLSALDGATRKLVTGPAPDVEAALRRVKTDLTDRGTKLAARSRVPASGIQMLLGVAAVLVAVAGVYVLRRPVSTPDAESARTFATRVGQRDSMRLADGSTVLLGPASRVVVRGRSAEVSGNALFRVVHDEKHPFVVRAGDVVIRDLGTEFSVHRGGAVRVVVREGVVQLKYQNDSVTLRQGDVGVVAATGQVSANRGAASADDLAWTHGELVLRDLPLIDVAPELRRWFGVEVVITDSSLAGRSFTGTFRNETPKAVLDIIALALDARVEWRGDTAYLGTAPSRR